jgi:UPF0716 protein FxsA
MHFLFYTAVAGLPILDLETLVEVGGWIGAWPTVGIMLLSATIGIILLCIQGVAILTQARSTLNKGRFPAREVFDGACVLIGGALLVLPGFASDLVGLILLMPPARFLMRRLIAWEIRRSGRFAIWTLERQPVRAPGGGTVIEGEYKPVEAATPQEGEKHTSGNSQRAQSPWRRANAVEVVPSDET